MKIFSARRGLLAAVALLTLTASGCAVSDQLDLSDASVTGAGGTGSTGSGSGGTDQGSTGGSQVTGEGGAPGTGGIIGTGGSGTGGKGTGGNGTGGNGTGGNGTGGNGTGGNGTGGSATGGTTGTGGIKGTGGSIATGGTNGSGGVKGTGGTGGAAAPTFTQVYAVLVQYCSGSNCHNPGSQKGISFSSQSVAYTAVKGRVTPGNGAGSSLYNTCNSGSMPPSPNPKLSSTNLAMLKAWIDAGALNN